MIGIYKLTTNEHTYVGSSLNLKSRKIQHFSDLKHNRHDNYKMQKLYNGGAIFKFEVLETFNSISMEDLRIKENYYKNLLKADLNIQDPLTNFECKSVYQYNSDGKFVKEWRNVSEAAIELGISTSNIRHAAEENESCTKTANGFYWRYTKCAQIDVPKDNRHKEVHLYSIAGDYIKTYQSGVECRNELFPNKLLDTVYQALSNCNDYIIGSYGGYRFSFTKEEHLDNSKLLHLKRNFPIVQKDLNGNIIEVYDKPSTAAKKFNCSSCYITQAIVKGKTAYGYR